MSHKEKGLNEFTSAISQELTRLPCSHLSIPPKGPDLWLLAGGSCSPHPGLPTSQPGQQSAQGSLLPRCRQPITAALPRRGVWPAAAGRKGPYLPSQQTTPGESSLGALHKYLVLPREKRDCPHKQGAEKTGMVQRHCSKWKRWHRDTVLIFS